VILWLKRGLRENGPPRQPGREVRTADPPQRFPPAGAALHPLAI